MTTQKHREQYEKDLLEIAPRMLEVLDRGVIWAISYAKASRQEPTWLDDAKAVIQKIKK
jgi:hypothetical protein